MKQTAPLVPYKDPQISTANRNEWFVFFRFFHADKWHLIKLREGINREKDLKKRKVLAEGLLEARKQWLVWGWNPILDPEYKLRKVIKKNDVANKGFNDAMDFALSKKVLAKKSRQDYRNVLNHLKEVAEKTGFGTIPVSQFEPFHVMELMDAVKTERGLSNHSYNKYLDTMRSMFTVLKRRQVVKYNPASDMEHFKVAESNKYVSLTPEEKAAIAKAFIPEHFRFFVFIQLLYHTGIRPKEILSLKISDIDLQNQLITIAPNTEEENSKTTSVRHVAIADQLLPFLEDLELEKHPSHLYAFGSPFPPGGGNRGSLAWVTVGKSGEGKKTGQQGAKRADYFEPSLTRIKRDTVTKLWNKLVMDPFTGLGINKHLYALKHTGADDKILAGIELDALRELYGHQSKLMTEVYAKKIKEVNRKQIRTKAPAFAPTPLRKVI